MVEHVHKMATNTIVPVCVTSVEKTVKVRYLVYSCFTSDISIIIVNISYSHRSTGCMLGNQWFARYLRSIYNCVVF